MPNPNLQTSTIENCIKFTRVKSTNPKELRKRYSVENGEVVKTSIAQMIKGKARTETVNDLAALSTVIDSIKKDEALLSGVFPKNACHIATKKMARPEKDVFSRSLDHVAIAEDACYLQLLDNDPHKDGVTFKSAQEAIDYVCSLSPEFEQLEILARPSSSAGIQLDGEEIKKAVSWHLFIRVMPNVLPSALADYIKALCWQRGDGYIALSKIGAKLDRCTFDLKVFSPERLIFEAKPKLEDGLTRKKYATAHKQGRAFCIDDLKDIDQSQIELLIAQAKADIDPEAKIVREEYQAEKIQELEAQGIDRETAERAISNLSKQQLTLDAIVVLSDNTPISVRELCENHKLYDLQSMADPIEGRSYGTTTAKFFWNDGRPVINSMAHGGIVYKLVESYTPTEVVEQKTCIPLNQPVDRIDIPHAKIMESGAVVVPSTIESTCYLMAAYGFTARYNVTSKNVEMSTPLDGNIVQDNAFDFGVSLLQSQAALNELNVGHIPNYVNAIAQTQHYNPIVEWFESREWDGVSRINTLCECIGVEAGWESARKTYVTKWLLGAAGMQLNEGAYSTRGTLVFAGQQNIGKTFFLQMLTGDMWKYCLDGLTLNPSDRDSIKKFCSHWIIELGELDATFRKSDISALKAFLTLKKDTMRLAYGRGESTFPRRTVSIASVNDRTFLRDETGNSRYWCLPVERFDFEKLRGIDIQQLWAEVWQHVKFALEVDPVGLPWFLNQEESDQLETNNANFEEPCEITATLIRYIKPQGTEESWCTSKELWSAKDIAQLLQLDHSVKTLRIIGKVMRERLGYEFEPPIRNRCYHAFVPDLSSHSIAKSFRDLDRE